ncbi:MFS transporter [Sutcliffiella horikoshii]|uniref:MFS transporter n=1 Tax=Sutcliffiella horikoshii TaxID=79883 RepID=A0A5D4T619_9BACI|nr:MFS transporter [Sutcliffiella horikoshii]TYS71043.1 MFS transporter [Sutcliffiella horikoshii]
MDIFKNKNFTWMFLGRILTNVGDSLYAVAAMWLVYDLGGSTFYTGLAGFLSIIPRLIQFFSGPLVDRLPIRPILIYTQLLQAILLLIVPLASYLNFLSISLVLIITPILTSLNMFVYPAQMAALPKFLKEKDLTKGNSLFTIAYQGIEITSNAISGILIVLIGAISIYVVDAVAFLLGAYIFSLIRMPIEKNVNPQKSIRLEQSIVSKYISELLDGLKIIIFTPLSRLLYGVIIINLAMGATFVVLPAFGSDKGGPEIYGLLLMAQALGSLLGALITPYLKLDNIPIGLLYANAFTLSGLAWGLSIFAPWNWLTIVIYGLAWIPGGVTNIVINTVIQKGIPEKLLGRVFSATISISGIASPLGGLVGGIFGVLVGSGYIILFSGLMVLLVGVIWFLDSVTRNLPSAIEIDHSTFGTSSISGYSKSL